MMSRILFFAVLLGQLVNGAHGFLADTFVLRRARHAGNVGNTNLRRYSSGPANVPAFATCDCRHTTSTNVRRCVIGSAMAMAGARSGGGGPGKGGGGGSKGGGGGKGGSGGGSKGGGGKGQGNAGGWPSTTGNPSGGDRSNNAPSK
jgi:hypothetical protein